MSLAVALLCASAALIGWLTWELRTVTVAGAEALQIRLADQAAAALARNIDRDVSLMEAVRFGLRDPAVERLDEAAPLAVLFDGVSKIGGMGEISVTDASGRIVVSLGARAATQTAVGDRRYFSVHRDDASAGLVISGPFADQSAAGAVLMLSRRRQDDADGFAGIVQAGIRISNLRTQLGQIDARPAVQVAVTRTDGRSMVAAPGPGSPATSFGADGTDMALVTALAAMRRSGTYVAAPAPDHVERLYAYSRLENVPLAVTVGIATSGVLASWTRIAWLAGLSVATLDVGAIGLILATGRQLRRRRTAERLARMAEHRLCLEIETIEDRAFFSLDTGGWVTSWNRGAQALLGYRADDVLGRPLALIVGSPDILPRPNAGAAGHEPHHQEVKTECRRKDGTVFSAFVVLSAVLEPGDIPAGHVVAIHDLTRQTQRERQISTMARADAIARVTAGVAHDFNNLLQAQILSLELLQERAEASSVDRELADIALNAAEQAARLTDQLLALSGQRTLRPSRVNLTELLAAVVSLARHSIGSNIGISSIVADGLPPILVDPALLQTALLNLIINARDAIDVRGTITLRGYAANIATDPPRGIMSATDFVVLAVTDNGGGMDPATAEQACEPFFTTKGARNSGLGLSMVQGFARQSGGEVRITSALDQGTTAEIWLPCASESQSVGEPVPPARALVGHILLVDEAADVLLVLAAFLRGSGFAVTQAANAREALCHLRRGTNFTMMISDFLLFGGDGLELAGKARQLRPGLPVLITTSCAHAERLSDLPPGFALLRKPFRKEDLLASVGALLLERPANSWQAEDALGSTDKTDAARPVSSSGPLDAGAVVEPLPWAASSHSPERRPKRTSA